MTSFNRFTDAAAAGIVANAAAWTIAVTGVKISNLAFEKISGADMSKAGTMAMFDNCKPCRTVCAYAVATPILMIAGVQAVKAGDKIFRKMQDRNTEKYGPQLTMTVRPEKASKLKGALKYGLASRVRRAAIVVRALKSKR